MPCAAIVGFVLAAASTTPATAEETTMSRPAHSYVGLWVTDDGHVRHELLPGDRYDEARGTRESAYRGRYEDDGKPH